MELTLSFAGLFIKILGLALPLILCLLSLIAFIGLVVGYLERWRLLDTLYWTFITSFAIGYGDRVPTRPPAKLLAPVIGFLGLIFNGLIVAIAVTVGSVTFRSYVEHHYHMNVEQVEQTLESRPIDRQ